MTTYCREYHWDFFYCPHHKQYIVDNEQYHENPEELFDFAAQAFEGVFKLVKQKKLKLKITHAVRLPNTCDCQEPTCVSKKILDIGVVRKAAKTYRVHFIIKAEEE